MALPPGPRSPSVLQTAGWWLYPFEVLDDCARRFGDMFTLRFASLGSVVMVSSPELVKQVFTGDPDVLRAGVANEILRPLLGRYSMLLLDGEDHMRQRRLCMPPFAGERMAVYGDIVQKSTLAALRSFPVGRPFRLHPSMQAITLDVILHAIFGLDEGPQLGRFASLLLEVFRDPPSFLVLLPRLRIDAPLSPYRTFLRARQAIEKEIYKLIHERRRAGDLAERRDILSLLLSARDEAGQPMSDEEVHDELMTLVTAGHETSATALAWTFERLLFDPDSLDRAAAEARGSAAEGPPSQAKLSYIDAVIKETLRLRPIIPLVGRAVFAPFELGGYTLPAGSAVAPCIYLAHRRAETYPEPERFRPERWLGAKVDPYAWLPFGGGVRRCIGMGFALYEMRVIVATVLAHVTMRRASPAPERPTRRAVTLVPHQGARVVVTHNEVA